MERGELIDVRNERNRVSVLFNPGEVTVESGAHYAEIQVPGLQHPLLQFMRGNGEMLSMELFVDRTSSRQSISEDLAAIRRFVEIQGEYHAPPVVRFAWGDIQFMGVVTTLRERFLLFDEVGHIMRARVNVTMKRFIPAEVQFRSPPRESPDRNRVYVVREGDRLDHIAEEAYGDSRRWRSIARANDISRPGELCAGAVLTIPAL